MYSHPLVSTACAALRQSGSEAQVVRIVAILGNDRDAMAIAEDGHIELGAALGVIRADHDPHGAAIWRPHPLTT
jgi:hypothetical protein